MIRDRLKQYFSDRGLNEVNLHMPGMDLYYAQTGSSASLVWMIDDEALVNLSAEAYQRYLSKIKLSFQNRKYELINTLTLFLTGDCKKALSVATGTAFWVVDEKYGRVVIYENQPDDYLGIRLAVEQFVSFLTAERVREAEAYNAAEAERKRRESYAESIVRSRNESMLFNNGKQKKPAVKQKKNRPYVAIALVLINVLVLLLVNLLGDVTGLASWQDDGAVSWYEVFRDGEYYRLFTCMFLHAGIDHVFGNMLALFFIGGNLEQIIGHVRFLTVYLLGGLGAGLFSCCFYFWSGEYVYSIGASGAVFAVEGAYIVYYLLNRNKLDGETKINGVGLAVYAAYALISGMSSPGIDNAAHLGGLLAGSLICSVFYVFDMIFKKKRSAG